MTERSHSPKGVGKGLSFSRGLWIRVLILLAVLHVLRLFHWMENQTLFFLLGISLFLLGLRYANRYLPSRLRDYTPSQKLAFGGFLALIYLVIGVYIVAHKL